MNKFYLYIILAILTLVSIHCSDNQNFQGRMNPKDRAAQLKERLDLTDEQTEKIEKIYSELYFIGNSSRNLLYYSFDYFTLFSKSFTG